MLIGVHCQQGMPGIGAQRSSIAGTATPPQPLPIQFQLRLQFGLEGATPTSRAPAWRERLSNWALPVLTRRTEMPDASSKDSNSCFCCFQQHTLRDISAFLFCLAFLACPISTLATGAPHATPFLLGSKVSAPQTRGFLQHLEHPLGIVLSLLCL